MNTAYALDARAAGDGKGERQRSGRGDAAHTVRGARWSPRRPGIRYSGRGHDGRGRQGGTHPTAGASRHDGRGGQVAIIFALLIVVLVGFVGLAVDIGNARVQAEAAQHAADAGALAGVVFMPNDFASAQTRAMQVANSDGYTTTARTTVTVSPDAASPYRLDVSITTAVPTTFLNVLGVHSITISRKAIAEFTTPIQLGSPDHMLGFGPYPTTAISNTDGSANTTAGETFYLETRGRYARKENGDAFSPWYSSMSGALTGGGHYLLNGACSSACGQPAASTDGAPNNPCASCAGALTANPDNAAQPSGLNFIFYVPPSLAHTQLALKIMDPFDESQLSHYSATVYDPAGHQVGTQYIDQSPNGSGSQLTCVPLNTAVYSACNSNGQGSAAPTHDAPTTLQYTLFAPGQTSIDNSQPALTAFSSGSVSTGANPYSYQIGPNPLIGGPDRDSKGLEVGTISPAITPGTGVYAWRWVTLALVTGSGYYRLNVQPTQNSSYADLNSVFNGTYGTGGNSYALGICTSDGTTPFASTDPFSPTASIASVQSRVSLPAGITSTVAFSSAAPSGQYYDAGCGDPNLLRDGAGSLLVQPGAARAAVYGQSAMTMINTIPGSASGNIIIPLAFVPSSYAGKEMAIRLFDVGDINGQGKIAVLNPAGTVAATTSYTYGLSLQSDSGSGYGQGSWQPCAASAPSAANCTQSGWSGPITNPYDADTGGASPPLAVASTTSMLPIRPAGSWTGADSKTRYGFSNGTWLNFIVAVPASYARTYPSGGWWKVLYNVGAGGNDTTTWEVQVIGDPIHLVNPGSS